MPAEWAPHQATLMEWPTITRAEIWGDLFDRAKADFAAVANAAAAFEPVVMVTDPAQAAEARVMCGGGVEILPIPIDDSWMRDNGPIFVTDGRGGVALVHFRFNAWGEKYLPYDRDAQVPERIASHLGMRRYQAPMILEGGSFFVDGGAFDVFVFAKLACPATHRKLPCGMFRNALCIGEHGDFLKAELEFVA